jgi:hypothetical protein
MKKPGLRFRKPGQIVEAAGIPTAKFIKPQPVRLKGFMLHAITHPFSLFSPN